MREALATHLEQFSYYQHQELTGGVERPIHAFRVLDVRGTRYFVLSRIQDAGLDFTKRTNFLAHHLAFTSEEIASVAAPPLLFLCWDGWKMTWDGEPELLAGEDWGNLTTINGFERAPDKQYPTAPARFWKEKSGAHVNAYSLLDRRGPVWLAVDGLTEDETLHLLAESLRMIELRNRDTDYHSKCWQVSFTTNLQEQDNPNDFRWKCVRREVSELNRKLAEAEVVELEKCYSTAHTAEEVAFAEKGPCPAGFKDNPQEGLSTEGSEIALHVKVLGLPYPTVEWVLAGKRIKAETGFTSSGEIWSTCAIRNLEPGSKQDCKVIARNAYGEVSAVITISVEKPEAKRVAANVEDLRYDGPNPKSAPTVLLVTLILEHYKNEGKKRWACLEELDGNSKHYLWENVDSIVLDRLYEFCLKQNSPVTERIAKRCARKLGVHFRISRYLSKHLWQTFVFVAITYLAIILLIWNDRAAISDYLSSVKRNISSGASSPSKPSKDKPPK